jgi:hypothetical protein
VPTLKEFAERDFLPFIHSTKSEKPNTIRFYKNTECLPQMGRYSTRRHYT